jgi:uncharacterized protein (DUF1501 family)
MPQRREFLTMTAGLMAGASLSAPGHAIGAVDRPGRANLTSSSCPRGLIVVELSGGNDGLNTLIPFASTKYRAVRPTLAIPRGEVIALTAEAGLHSALAPLLPFWEAGELAFERAVGPVSGQPSHAAAVESWRQALAAAGRSAASRDCDESSFEAALVAGVDEIANREGPVTVRASLAGFDTHTRQAEIHGVLLARLAGGLVACRSRSDAVGVTGDIRIVVVSEFGRTVTENAFGGTDHGAGGLMLILGRGVNPGRQVEALGDSELAAGTRGELGAKCRVEEAVSRWCGVANG